MLYQIDNHEDFNPDTDLNTEDHQTLTAHDVEERIDATLRAWGWTEESRDDATGYLASEDDTLAWETDTELAYALAVNAPSGTPLHVFTAVLEARGWPRTPYFQ